MTGLSPNASERERPQKLLFYLLTGLLIAFSAWCGVLLWRAHVLRQDLENELIWMEDVRRLHGDLDGLRAGATTEEGTVARKISAPLLAGGGNAELQVAAANLRRALDELNDRLAAGTTPDAVWEASETARSALMTLEGRIHAQVADLYLRLGNLWNGLYLLIVASLLLAASNLGLLRLAQTRRRRLEQAHDEALRQSTQDPLTQVWNREAILKLLRRELVRAERLGSPLGVILADLDGFQQVNVLHGQDQGDFILEQLAARLGSFVRPYDTMGRFGGDSFLIVLPVCDETATGNVAARLMEAVNERDMEHALGRIRITISMAYATVEELEDADADLLIHRLQERIAGLQAKGAGHLARLT